MSVATIENNTPATISPFSIRNQWEIEWAEDNPCLLYTSRTEPLMDNKVAGRRKITSCYYLTDKAIRALGLGTEPAIRHINKLEQPKRAKQNEFFVEWYLKEWPNWAYFCLLYTSRCV